MVWPLSVCDGGSDPLGLLPIEFVETQIELVLGGFEPWEQSFLHGPPTAARPGEFAVEPPDGFGRAPPRRRERSAVPVGGDCGHDRCGRAERRPAHTTPPG